MKVETSNTLRADLELRFYRELVAASGEGIYRLDFAPPIPLDLDEAEQVRRILLSGRLAAANPAMARMYGFASEEELIGRAVSEMLVVDNPITQSSLHAFVRGGYRYRDVESVEVDRQGAERIFLNSAVGVVEEGHLVAAWGKQRDLTEERQMLERLRQSERRFATAFHVNPGGLSISSLATGRFLDVNETFARLIGLPRQELIGKSGAELGLWDGAEERQRVIAAVLQDGFVQRLPARVRSARGEPRQALISAMRIEMDGEACLLVLAEDVTEQRAAEAERRRLERDMQSAQRLDALGRLAGGVAHDFNNLLTGIQGYAELARRKAGDASPIRPLLDEILVGAQRAAELTQKMLAFAGGGQLEVAWLGLNEIVREMAELVRVAMPATRTLHLELARPGPGLEGDATQIRQVVLNLLLNASEAIPGEGGTITVATGECSCDRDRLDRAEMGRALEEGRYAYLSVADDGAGIGEEALPRIFEPFFSTKFTGRGLGLAAVLGIVRAHRGAIELETAPGTGTRFTILLPLALTAVPAAER